jgi:hypothetical protein
MPISVTCPQCGVQHPVADRLAGARAKCPCGQTLIIPEPLAERHQDEARRGEADTDLSLAPEEAVRPPTATPDETEQRFDATLYYFAISQLQSGVQPDRVIRELQGRGLSKGAASALVRHLGSPDYSERAKNRIAGRTHVIRGMVALLGGTLVGLAGHHIGILVVASIVLVLLGLFQLIVGLMGCTTGMR